MVNDIALLLARTVTGGAIAAHGAQKAFGWFGGPGPDGTAKLMDGIGLRPGTTFGRAAALTELGAGSLIAVGFGGAIGPAMLVSTMTVAAETVHRKNGFFAQKNGVELPVLYLAAAVAIAGGGFGRFSVDEALGLAKYRSHLLTGLALAAGIGAATAILLRRETPVAKPAATPATHPAERTPPFTEPIPA
jgi:putative oxidoreductase